MFQHPKFDHYAFEEIPLNRDIYIMDESYLQEYEQSFLDLFEGKGLESVGEVGYIAVKAINDNSLECLLYANSSERFHALSISLPKDAFILCVGCWQYEEKPRIFVKSHWLKNLYTKSYSIFALIDAIDVKKALEKGILSRKKLIELRDEIDILATKYNDISFISFADSLLLKSNWTIGYFKNGTKPTYEPEIFIYIAQEIKALYQKILGLDTYAIITQGNNEYYEDTLLHISKSQNHISLNSLGAPFAQLQEIEIFARKAIREKKHLPSELYLDEHYHHSLKYKFEFQKKTISNNEYKSKMVSKPCKYYYASIHEILNGLKQESSGELEQVTKTDN